jgi:hypothetical protein
MVDVDRRYTLYGISDRWETSARTIQDLIVKSCPSLISELLKLSHTGQAVNSDMCVNG